MLTVSLGAFYTVKISLKSDENCGLYSLGEDKCSDYRKKELAWWGQIPKFQIFQFYVDRVYFS